ncbi:Protease 2 [Sesamum angolense]|uniref:Protease 2 n=1 Tax=Sesamum angolense TaxID=2727404 RepID=A0AAE1X0P6_9LAMI|nr:Protease 2 [Sesamum angolense]
MLQIRPLLGNVDQFVKLFKSSSSTISLRRSLSVRASLLSSNMEPPIAKKVKHDMEMFGDVRVDNYYWLRDDSRSDAQVLAYLREENAYTDHLMSGFLFGGFLENGNMDLDFEYPSCLRNDIVQFISPRNHLDSKPEKHAIATAPFSEVGLLNAVAN